MKNILDALHKATQDTAKFMTADIRRSARQHGWAPHEVNSLKVSYQDKAFTISAEGENASDAWVKEFGSEIQRPTAVIRKYSNNPGKAADVFMKRLNKHAGGPR